MASSIHSVQNFSLPSRAGSRRTVTPIAASLDRDVCYVDRVVPIQHFQLVQTYSRAAVAAGGGAVEWPPFAGARRPRPMSTSSSAPALATSASAADGELEAVRPATGYQACCRAWRPRHHYHHPLLPSSPAGSVWPPPVVPRASAAQDGEGGEKVGDKVGREGQKQLSSQERRPPSRTQSRSPSFDDVMPPPLARSISIRWGPRLRHISLSEVQAADDAVRHLAALRRHRLIFWLLAAGLLAGMLSCTAALTLVVVARAAVGGQMGQTGQTSTMSWESHGIAWLVGSLVASALAGAVLSVVGWRWRQRQMKWRRRSGIGEGGGEEEGVEIEGADDSRDWIEMAEMANLSGLSGGGQRRNKVDNDGNNASSYRRRTAWWKKGGRSGITKADVANTQSARPAEDAHVEGKNPPAAVGGGDGKVGGIADCEKKEDMEEDEEDRNWARFAQDPLQLRRYVEALEARLAAAQGMPDKMGGVVKGVVKDEADKAVMAADEVEDTDTADTTDKIDEIAEPAEIANSAEMSSSSSPVVGGLAISGPDASSSSPLLPLPQPLSAEQPPQTLEPRHG